MEIKLKIHPPLYLNLSVYCVMRTILSAIALAQLYYLGILYAMVLLGLYI